MTRRRGLGFSSNTASPSSLDGVGRPDSNLQDQGTPSLVVVTHFEVRVGVEEPRARAVDDYIYSDLGLRIGFGYSNSELSI